MTYGHRFLATTGRPGRAIRVRSYADYRKKLAEQFVVLDRQERKDRIARDLENRARQLGGRVLSAARSSFLDEVPDLVEYPGVVAGRFDQAFLSLPPEVLTTTMIHHQRDFPVVDDRGVLQPVFLAVTNTVPPDERLIVANAERVLAVRLRDAAFFWTRIAKRRSRLASIVSTRCCSTRRLAATAGRPSGSPDWRSGSRASRSGAPTRPTSRDAPP